MSDSFGARLRQQREKRGIALAAIAKQTRIKESLLDALERDDLSQWPSGLYRRAFFRAYVAAIALDPDTAFAEFQAAHPEPPEVDVVAAMAATLGRESGRAAGLRDAVGSAFSSLTRFRRGSAGELFAAEMATLPQNATQPLPAVSHAPTPPQSVTVRDSQAAAVQRSSGSVVDDAPVAGRTEPPQPASARSEADSQPAVTADGDAGRTLLELARLSSELGCVTTGDEVQALLQDAARLLDATGVIVWAWNPHESKLQPTFFYGYSIRVVAQLPLVGRDESNATAVAFRTAQPRIIHEITSGECAFVVPLRTAAGCVGVFAVELRRGEEATNSRLAVATVLATQLAAIADCMSQPEQLPLPQAVNGAG